MGAVEATSGSLVGDYRLEAILGSGGMGVVWSAVHVATGASVALKLWKPSAADSDLRARVLREARAARAVQHAHVVKVLDVIELDDGAPAIAMERLVGESLEDRLRAVPRLALREVADLLAPVISAVGTAHALGVVHRDLKPANIFLCADGIAKVLDFGIAKLTALDDESIRSHHGTTGVVQGTPMYMAPEQVYAEPDIDHRADIWSLGLVLYQCLSGVLPTRADNHGQVFKLVTAKPFAPLSELAAVPDDVAALVMHMLERERDHRAADLREARDVLASHAGDDAVRAAAAFDGPRFARRQATAERERSRWSPPVTTRRARPWRAVIAASSVGLAAVGGAVAFAVSRSPTAPPVAIVAAPLRDPASVIACPVFDASGVEEPAGWLGAAAAVIACERARAILGGAPNRTLEPAELLELGRAPVDHPPPDPYGDPRARDASLDAARRRASAYLDGRVAMQGDEVHVALELHARDGAIVAHAEATARGLPAAIRDAMAPLVAAGWIPVAARVDPRLAPWLGTDRVASALALLDLTFAMADNAGDLAADCARFARDARTQLGALASRHCANLVGGEAIAVALGPDAATGPLDAAGATHIRVKHLVHDPARRDDPADDARLARLASSEPSSWGRALIAATRSCLVQGTDASAAFDLALAAVADEPKLTDGDNCNAWEQLAVLALGRGSGESAARAMQVWAPWNSNAWLAELYAATDRDRALVVARRAHALAPFDLQIVAKLADALFAADRPGEVRAIANRLGAVDSPANRFSHDLLIARADAADKHFAAARAKTLALLAPQPGDRGWERTARFEAAWRALDFAQILGDPATPDALVHALVDGDAPLISSWFEVPRHLPAICAAASPAVARTCFDRMRELRPRFAASVTPETEALARGAELYARDDLRGAAKAWRPLVSGSGDLARAMPLAMIRAFDASGDVELAEKVEATAMARASELGGATLAHGSAARRALAHGDRAAARHLAQQVIDAWSVADEDVPAIAELRAIATR